MAADRPAPVRRSPEVQWPDLHLCPSCSRPFVIPRATLDVLGDDRYMVELACMNCEWSDISTAGEERLEALDHEMSRQCSDIRSALALMTVTRELEEIDAFTQALGADLILPEDF